MWLLKLKNLACFFVVAISLTLGGCASASKFAAVYTNDEGLALKGYDAVAYYAVDQAVQGNQTYEYAWNGAKWLFSSSENLAKFKENPEAYAPQYGGNCSYAVSKGYTAEGDPQAWKIVDGKLFLNYSTEVKEAWEKDQEANIKKGEENWKKMEVAGIERR